MDLTPLPTTPASAIANSEAVRPRFRVLAVAVSDTKRVEILNDLNRVVRAGGEALLVVSDRELWEPIGPKITVIDLSRASEREGLNRIAGMSPGRVAALGLGMAAIGSRSMSRAAIGLGVATAAAIKRPGSRRPPWWGAWKRTGLYRDTRGWSTWLALKHRLREIDLDTLDYVIYREVDAWSVVWNLSQRKPELAVGFSVNRDRLAAFSEEMEAYRATLIGARERRIRRRSRTRRLARRAYGTAPARAAAKALPAGLRERARRGLNYSKP